MPIRIRLYRHPRIQSRGVVLEILAQVIRIDGVAHVRGDEEAVGVSLGERVGAEGGVAEGLADAADGGGEEVAVRALAQEGADFFVVEEGD